MNGVWSNTFMALISSIRFYCTIIYKLFLIKENTRQKLLHMSQAFNIIILLNYFINTLTGIAKWMPREQFTQCVYSLTWRKSTCIKHRIQRNSRRKLLSEIKQTVRVICNSLMFVTSSDVTAHSGAEGTDNMPDHWHVNTLTFEI